MTVLCERQLHALNAIAIVVRRVFQDLLHRRRKNRIFIRLAHVSSVSVESGLADAQRFALNGDRPSIRVLQDEVISLMRFYFFRLTAKKPSASFRISFARLVSRSSFSNS